VSSFNFVGFDRDQMMLLPPSLSEWLAEDHLAWFVIDAVKQLDLAEFYASYRDDGWGRAAHHPEMMVTLLVYAYSTGVMSSRRIEQGCQSDVAFRVITANVQPDHTTIARFRRRHVEALKDLFVQTLRLCAEAGLVRVGLVALDGTKIAGAASLDSNRSRSFIDDAVETMFADAETADQADEAAGDDNEPPAAMRGRAARQARFQAAKAVLDEREAAERAVFDAKIRDRQARDDEMLARTGHRMNGRKPAPFTPKPDVRVNVVDPDSRVMKTKHRYLQGFNAQAVTTRDQIIIAAEVLIATRNRRKTAVEDQPAPRGRIPKSATPRERMDRKLATKRGRQLYRKRSGMIEPVFGQIKHNRGQRTFLLRGLDGVNLEWKLWCTTHNLLKMFRTAAV
jgi:transposase